MSQLKYRNETEAYRALVDVVPFAVRDAIGAEIYRASNGQFPCLHEARTLARKYCSPASMWTAIEVIDQIDWDAIREAGIADLTERAKARLCDLGLDAAFLDIELKGCTLAEHLDWICTADAAELCSYRAEMLGGAA